jgi:hypothetical protein
MLKVSGSKGSGLKKTADSPRYLSRGLGALAAALVMGVFIGFGLQTRVASDVSDLADGVAQASERPSLENEALTSWPKSQPVSTTVRLAFSASKAMKGVTLTLELPPSCRACDFPR